MSDSNSFFKHVNSKKRSKENTGLILDVDDPLTSKDRKKAKAFNDSLASVFNSTDRSGAARSSELESHGLENSNFSFIVFKIMRDRLYHLNIQKSIGSDEIEPRVMKKLADVTAGPFLKIYQKPWVSEEVPANSFINIYKKGIRKDICYYRSVSLTLDHERVTKNINLGDSQLKNIDIMKHSQL